FWTVESESNLSNYNLLRSENDEAQVLIYSVNAENLSTTHTYEYHDYEVEPGTYTYWLESVENDGSFTVYDPCSITVVEGEQPGDDDDDVTTRLMGNYPNPFTGVTEIFFNLGTDEVENIEIEIYNMRGQLVKQCAVPNDQSSVSWSAANKATGVYIYKLVVDGKEVDAGKMILSK
ncbi:MAG: T9SS type A sorting domain-containing protein, partial [Candidatus Cloacimonetes bacterium]|nr:T9SS type A sorting domain-containing protein [Candidatus Cloacimonadota bacterium]